MKSSHDFKACLCNILLFLLFELCSAGCSPGDGTATGSATAAPRRLPHAFGPRCQLRPLRAAMGRDGKGRDRMERHCFPRWEARSAAPAVTGSLTASSSNLCSPLTVITSRAATQKLWGSVSPPCPRAPPRCTGAQRYAGGGRAAGRERCSGCG